MPNPGDYKPCSAEEIRIYKYNVLARNINRLKRMKCPECNCLGSLNFTGELLDFDAAFIECSKCSYKWWILLKDTGLPSEICRYRTGDRCSRNGSLCKHLKSDMRECSLFKEAISVSHSERMLKAKEIEV